MNADIDAKEARMLRQTAKEVLVQHFGTTRNCQHHGDSAVTHPSSPRFSKIESLNSHWAITSPVARTTQMEREHCSVASLPVTVRLSQLHQCRPLPTVGVLLLCQCTPLQHQKILAAYPLEQVHCYLTLITLTIGCQMQSYLHGRLHWEMRAFGARSVSWMTVSMA